MSTASELAILEAAAGVVDPKRTLYMNDSGGWFRRWPGFGYHLLPEDALANRIRQCWDYIHPRVEWFSLGIGHDKRWTAVLDIPDGETGETEDYYDTEAEALVSVVEAIAEHERTAE